MILEETEQIAGGKMAEAESRKAARALRGAAMISAVRAILMPILISWAPPGTFPGADTLSIQVWGYLSAAIFLGLSIWATRDPLRSTLCAFAFYAMIAIPDILNNTGFLAQGWISKMVMSSILIRAIVAGMLHRSYTGCAR